MRFNIWAVPHNDSIPETILNQTFWLRDTWHSCENLGTAYECSTRGGALLESLIRTAMHGKSRVLSAVFFSKINKISDSFSLVVAQWVRRWSSNHRVVQAEGSSPRGDVYQFFFKR